MPTPEQESQSNLASSRAPIAPSVLKQHHAIWANAFVQHLHLKPYLDHVEGMLSTDFVAINLHGVTCIERRLDGSLRKATFCPGETFIQPRSAPRSYVWSSPGQTLHIYLPNLLLNVIAPEITSRDPASIHFREQFVFNDPFIYQIGLSLVEELHNSGCTGIIYAESLLMVLTLYLLRKHSMIAECLPTTSKPIVKHSLQRAIDYIKENLSQNITLENLAAVVNLSPYYFARLFKEEIGIAPHQYLIQQRVERAKQLLIEGNLSLAQIANCVGFADQSHLSRHFKQHLGLSPKALALYNRNRQNSQY